MNKRMIVTMIFAVCAFLNIAAAAEPTVEFFTPQGEVKGVRQVTARFSEQMVPFGDPRLMEPFDVKCPEKGRQRWADGRNWVYDFEHDLPAGVQCEFTVRPDVRTLAGGRISGQHTFRFSTGGPAVRRSKPYEGSQISEDQFFILSLDARPKEQTVLEHASCEIEGINERVGVRIVTGDEQKQALQSATGRRWRSEEEKLHEIVLQCRQNFPNDRRMTLVWGKGIESLSGVPTAQDQRLPFLVRPPFMATFSCQRENPQAACIPFLPMSLSFSSPVPWEQAVKIALQRQGGGVFRPSRSGDEDLKNGTVSAVSFSGPFPEHTRFSLVLPPVLNDDAGRTLSNRDKFPLVVTTDEYPPLAKFSSRFGIIEKADPVLPVTLRNLEPEVKARMLAVESGGGAQTGAVSSMVDAAKQAGKGVLALFSPEGKPAVRENVSGKMKRIESDNDIILWLRRVAAAGRRRSVFDRTAAPAALNNFTLPKPGGAKAFEVVGIPLRSEGFYVVELESSILGASLLGAARPVYVPTTALVTNLSAHFKWGREGSLVWVTRLDNAEPVPNAEITVRDCKGTVRWQGVSDVNGIARFGEGVVDPGSLPVCREQDDYESDSWMDHPDKTALQGMGEGLFVFARSGSDMTFVHTSWHEGIEPWRFGLPEASYRGPIIAHTIFDRTLLRAGETVSMKHIIRKHTLRGFTEAPLLPQTVLISHQGSDQRYEMPVSWTGNGIAETQWKIPADAKLGTYQVTLLTKAPGEKKQRRAVGGYEEGDEDYFQADGWTSGSFRVEEFRVPLMKAIVQPPREPLVNAREANFDLFVSYLSGGGAGELPVKLRTQTQPHAVAFDAFEGYTFATGGVREGIDRGARGRQYYEEYFEGGEGEGEPDETGGRQAPTAPVRTLDLMLDRAGAFRATVKDLPKTTLPLELVAEMEFRDPNGEVKTASGRTALWPSNELVGIKPDAWLASKDSFKFYLGVADVNGRPVPNRKVEADFFQRKTYSHRKRLVGGFYAYEHVTETKRVDRACSGVTNEKGIVICETKAPVTGNVIIQARSTDESGNVSVSHRETWVAGSGEWWFEVGNNDRIDLLPEKKRYEPGDTARFQVRMPFREATALVTVEREGVAESFVKKITSASPMIEVPLRQTYAPNIYVSVLCVRGRVGDVQPTAMVDLGRPAFKLGIAEINVGWKGHELKVSVVPEREVFKVREKASVRVKVRTAAGQVPPAGSEVTIAAVDEGLLSLMPNGSWKLLEAMMGRRGYEVRSSTAQMQVVGKRHYGLKALPAGGGGGRQTTRELFDTLLLWKGRVVLNAAGEAKVEIPLNDSITSFRIAAIANGAIGLFGSGEATIRTTQDLMLLSGLPPVVREGDRFRAGFTVRNASNRTMDVELAAAVSGGAASPEARSASFSPGEAKEMFWETTAPLNATMLTWDVTAREKGGTAADKLRIRQKIVEAVQARVFQATITQVEKPQTITVERPKDALPGKGGINVSFRKKLTNGLGGVTWFMKNYPYTCMEQKTSRAIALRDEALWKSVLAELPSHLDGDGLVKYFPTCTWGSDSLTAYMLQISHEAGWPIPQNLRKRMEDGLKGFIEGRVIRWSSLPTADVSIRKMAAFEALSRTGNAAPKLLGSITLEPNLWPTSAVIDWLNALMRVETIPSRDARMKEAEQIIRSRINFQGTTMTFSTEKSDYLWWLMLSGDVNSVRSVLTFLDRGLWKEDMPRLVRGAVGRQYHGAWSTTVANAWGVLAMEKFSKKFESVPVTGVSKAALGDSTQSVDWQTASEGSSVMFGWPAREAGLALGHQGTGKPWATVQSIAAIPLKQPFTSGYVIKKTITPLEQKKKGTWSRGDVARITLELEAQSDMTWVVVNDPIPAGAAILGSGLGGDSQLLTRGEKRAGWAWPVFTERTFTSYRGYYEFVAKGKWTLEYTIRLNTSGSFNLPETRVEALYAPEMFGEWPNAKMDVQ